MKFFLFLLLLFIPGNLLAKADDAVRWSRWASPKGDVTFSMPDGHLVDADGPGIRLMYRNGSVSLTFGSEREADPKGRLMRMRAWRRPYDEGKHLQVSLGKFSGDLWVWDKKTYSISLTLASNKGYYTIYARAPLSSDATLEKFLRSFRLDGMPLVKTDKPEVFSETPASVSTLKTSPEIKAALKRPDAKQVKVLYDRRGGADPSAPPGVDEKNSQAVLILRKPQARYTSDARQSSTSGMVQLKVHLGADGQILDITVLKDLKDGLTDSAINAAKAIKYLPAEKDGKPVDSFVTIEYTFEIY